MKMLVCAAACIGAFMLICANSMRALLLFHRMLVRCLIERRCRCDGMAEVHAAVRAAGGGHGRARQVPRAGECCAGHVVFRCAIW